MVLPSGDHTGWRASLNGSVMRVARPPVAGITQMLPCKSIASILPSGEAATAMEVPSSTVTVTGLETGSAALTAVTHNANASGINLGIMIAPFFGSSWQNRRRMTSAEYQ